MQHPFLLSISEDYENIIQPLPICYSPFRGKGPNGYVDSE